MSDQSKPVVVVAKISEGDPENCMHCRVQGWLTRGILDELGGEIDVEEYLGALVSCAADVIARAPTRAIRKAALRQAIDLLREESKPDGASAEHLH